MCRTSPFLHFLHKRDTLCFDQVLESGSVTTDWMWFQHPPCEKLRQLHVQHLCCCFMSCTCRGTRTVTSLPTRTPCWTAPWGSGWRCEVVKARWVCAGGDSCCANCACTSLEFVEQPSLRASDLRSSGTCVSWVLLFAWSLALYKKVLIEGEHARLGRDKVAV